MKQAQAQWTVNLHTTCPYCSNWFDIFDDWYYQEMWTEVEVGQTKELTGGFEITCPECKKEFEISDTEH